MRNAGTAFTILIFLGFVTTVVVMNWYPAAIIKMGKENGGRAHIIWKFQIQKVADSALMYYKNALINGTSTLMVTAVLQEDAYQKSRETLLENLIVHDAVEERGLTAEAEKLITEKIKGYAAQPDFSVAVSLVYGLDNSGFVELMARPEAERELIKEKRKWDDAALAAWIAEEKNRSRIVRFFK